MCAREHYDAELTILHHQLHELGNLAVTAVRRSLDALARQDRELARQVADDDRLVNDGQHRLEEHAISLIALQQPVARDLRTIMTAITVGSELERVADYAKSIAKMIIGPEGSPPLEVPAELLDLGSAAHATFEHALAALVARDEGAARALTGEEEQVDRMYKQLKYDLSEALSSSPAPTRAAELLFIAHNLERIADRATNIAERVVYLTSAKVVELNP